MFLMILTPQIAHKEDIFIIWIFEILRNMLQFNDLE